MIRTKFTKTMAFLLALAMMLTILPVTALADSEEFDVDDTVQTEGPVICTVCGTEDCDKVYAEVGLADDDDEDVFKVVIEDIDADDADADDADDVDVDEDVDLDAGLMNIGDYILEATSRPGTIKTAAFTGNASDVKVTGSVDPIDFNGRLFGPFPAPDIILTGTDIPTGTNVLRDILRNNGTTIAGAGLRIAGAAVPIELDYGNVTIETITNTPADKSVRVKGIMFEFTQEGGYPIKFNAEGSTVVGSFVPSALNLRVHTSGLITNPSGVTVANVPIRAVNNIVNFNYVKLYNINYNRTGANAESIQALDDGVFYAVVNNNFSAPTSFTELKKNNWFSLARAIGQSTAGNQRTLYVVQAANRNAAATAFAATLPDGFGNRSASQRIAILQSSPFFAANLFRPGYEFASGLIDSRVIFQNSPTTYRFNPAVVGSQIPLRPEFRIGTGQWGTFATGTMVAGWDSGFNIATAPNWGYRLAENGAYGLNIRDVTDPVSIRIPSNASFGTFESDIFVLPGRIVATNLSMANYKVGQFIRYDGVRWAEIGDRGPVWNAPISTPGVFNWSQGTAGGTIVPGTPIPGSLIIGNNAVTISIAGKTGTGASATWTFVQMPAMPRAATIEARNMVFRSVNNNQEYMVWDANGTVIVQGWTRFTGNNSPVPFIVRDNTQVWFRTAATTSRPPSFERQIATDHILPMEILDDINPNSLESYFTFNPRTGRLGTVVRRNIPPDLVAIGFVQNPRLMISNNGLHFVRAGSQDIRPYMSLGSYASETTLWGEIYVTIPANKVTPAIRNIMLQINPATGVVKVAQMPGAGEIVRGPNIDDSLTPFAVFGSVSDLQPAMLAPAAVVIPNPKGTEEEDE